MPPDKVIHKYDYMILFRYYAILIPIFQFHRFTKKMLVVNDYIGEGRTTEKGVCTESHIYDNWSFISQAKFNSGNLFFHRFTKKMLVVNDYIGEGRTTEKGVCTVNHIYDN